MKKSAWLHNIRSVYNVGSIFRTADAVGIDHIYLSGYTPLPVDRFGRNRSDMHKIALGAEQSLSWSQLKHIPQDIIDLQQSGAQLVCVEQNNRSVLYDAYTPDTTCTEIILAMGEEVNGFEENILDIADTIVEIPMRGEKESLNVSVAFGIVAYQMFK
ncbi:TrmH family RNA methyltransferase [Patescibacteria group bacterium]|nr:TrmH family RNA methyltransferase [Patescibacteria group bacterium]